MHSLPAPTTATRRREDAPLRVLVAFDGDVTTLPEAEQKQFKRAKALSGRTPPYAMLMYIWTDQVPVGSVIASAHTSQVKMLAVASGPTASEAGSRCSATWPTTTGVPTAPRRVRCWAWPS